LGNLPIFFIQFPWIKLDEYGLPRKEWFDDAEDNRQYDLKIPLNESNPNTKDLITLLKKTDAFLSSPETKTKLFKGKANKYKYHSIFHDIIIDADNSESNKTDKSKPVKQPYMIIKIDYEDADFGKKIKSIIFKQTDTKTKTKEIVKDINTIDDLRKHITYMCELYPIIRPCKLWAHNGNKKDPEYGLIFKLAKAIVQSQNSVVTKTSVKDYYNIDSFMDDKPETVEALESTETLEILPSRDVSAASTTAPTSVAKSSTDKNSKTNKPSKSSKPVEPVEPIKVNTNSEASDDSDEDSDQESSQSED
jgi:hypothetical protein